MASSPKEAKAEGVKTYFTGVPCKRGGIAERRLNGDCLCRACVDNTNQIKAKWVIENRDKHLKSKKKWAENNREKQREISLNWLKNNPDKFAKIKKKWRDNNRDKLSIYKRNRRASIINAKPKWFSEFDEFVVTEASNLVSSRLKATGIVWHVDHMIPLRAKNVCGLHLANNIQVIPAKLNASKRNNMVYVNFAEWIKEM